MLFQTKFVCFVLTILNLVIHVFAAYKYDLNKIPNIYPNNSINLVHDPICQDELETLCKHAKNNFEVMECLAEQDEQKLSADCQNQIWKFKLETTKLDYFTEITKVICKTLLNENHDCLEAENDDLISPGANILSCLIERMQPETENNCKSYLQQMELIIFSDYRLISKFTDACETKITELKCGRLDWETNTNSQGNTIECLRKHIDSLPPTCQHEILRISELQSNDFHLDKTLYFSCRSDRENFCRTIESGNGRVYKCLLAHMDEMTFSEECKEKLIEREQLIARDYKISKNLALSCKIHIENYHCYDASKVNKEVQLSQILLCLESSHAKGNF